MTRAGCSLGSACHCIGRAHGPGCRFWSADLDADIAKANERTAAERVTSPSVRYCDWDCIASKTVVVVHYGTVVCDGSCKRRAAITKATSNVQSDDGSPSRQGAEPDGQGEAS